MDRIMQIMKNQLVNRVLLFVIAIVGISTISQGQAKVELGLKGGVNLANINTEASIGENYDAATGFHIGPYLLVKVANIGIQPEILYSTKGTDISVDNISETLQQRSAYLDIPVMFKLYTVMGINIQAGPQVGLLLSAEQDQLTINGSTVDIEEGVDISEFRKSSDFSAAVGLGWDAPFGLNFAGRYVIGLSDINDADTGSDVKNNMWQFSLGYRLFKVGK